MTTVPNDANEPGDLRLRGRIISELHGGEADADIRTRATLSYGSDAWRALEAAAGLSPDEVRAIGDTVTLFRPFTSKEAERMHDVDTQNRLGLTEKIQRLLKDLNQRYHVRTGCAVGVERVGRGDPLAGDGNGVLAVRPIANLVDDDTGQLGLPNNSAEKLAVVAPRTLAWLLKSYPSPRVKTRPSLRGRETASSVDGSISNPLTRRSPHSSISMTATLRMPWRPASSRVSSTRLVSF